MENAGNISMQICERLFIECEPEMRKLCLHKLNSCPNEIDDAIAEAFLALCNAADKGKKINNPHAWLMKTLDNIIKRKYTEQNQKKKRYTSLENFEHELIYSVDFDAVRMTDEQIESLQREVYDELKISERLLLILIYNRGMKMAEIAKIFDTTEAAVKQRHMRLKIKLKEIIRSKMRNL